MIWVAWRQHRTTILSMLLAIAVAAAVMVYQYFAFAAAMDGQGAGACLRGEWTDSCNSARDNANGPFIQYTLLWPSVMQALSLVGGAIVGAVMYGKELAARTHLFSLTQSVSRRRWWMTKFAVVVLPLVLAMLALSAVAHWAFMPFFLPSGGGLTAFETVGLMPAAHFLFAVAIAATFGLARKSIVAPLVVGALVAIVIAVGLSGLRPYYMEPHQVRQDSVEQGDPTPEGGMWMDQHVVKAGSDSNEPAPECQNTMCDSNTAEYDTVTTYQPAERFWTFQGIETGIAVLLTAGALGAGALALRKQLP